MTTNRTKIRLFCLVFFSAVICLMTEWYCTITNQNNALASNTSVDLVVNEGSLSVLAPTNIQLTDTNLDTLPDTGTWSYNSYDNLVVRDHRSTSPGWSLTGTITDFTDGSNTIPIADKVLLYPLTLTPIGGSTLTGVSNGPVHTYTSTTDPATFMSATGGSGKGRFKQYGFIALWIDVAAAPGSYSGTLVLTVA